jgi:hypothetical protein
VNYMSTDKVNYMSTDNRLSISSDPPFVLNLGGSDDASTEIARARTLTEGNLTTAQGNNASMANETQKGGYFSSVSNFFSNVFFNKDWDTVKSEWKESTKNQDFLGWKGVKVLGMVLGAALNTAAKLVALLAPLAGAIAGGMFGGAAGAGIGVLAGSAVGIVGSSALTFLGSCFTNLALKDPEAGFKWGKVGADVTESLKLSGTSASVTTFGVLIIIIALAGVFLGGSCGGGDIGGVGVRGESQRNNRPKQGLQQGDL